MNQCLRSFCYHYVMPQNIQTHDPSLNSCKSRNGAILRQYLLALFSGTCRVMRSELQFSGIRICKCQLGSIQSAARVMCVPLDRCATNTRLPSHGALIRCYGAAVFRNTGTACQHSRGLSICAPRTTSRVVAITVITPHPFFGLQRACAVWHGAVDTL